jgi:hypothetical protein
MSWYTSSDQLFFESVKREPWLAREFMEILRELKHATGDEREQLLRGLRVCVLVLSGIAQRHDGGERDVREWDTCSRWL